MSTQLCNRCLPAIVTKTHPYEMTALCLTYKKEPPRSSGRVHPDIRARSEEFQAFKSASICRSSI